MSKQEDGSLLEAALKSERSEGDISARKLLEQERYRRTWPAGYKKDGQFMNESGAMAALRKLRNSLHPHFEDARILLSKEDPNGDDRFPLRLLLIWNNQLRIRGREGGWKFDAVNIAVAKGNNGILGIIIGGGDMYLTREEKPEDVSVARGHEFITYINPALVPIPLTEIGSESFEKAAKNTSANFDLVKGYDPRSPLSVIRRYQIDRMTIS